MIPLRILATVQAVHYRGESLAALPIQFQRRLGVSRFEMHPNGRARTVNQRVLHPSAMMIKAADWGRSVTLHLARKLGATNI